MKLVETDKIRQDGGSLLKSWSDIITGPQYGRCQMCGFSGAIKPLEGCPQCHEKPDLEAAKKRLQRED